MAYRLSIQHKGQYIHVKASGVTNLPNVLAIWKKVAQVCRRSSIKKVLCEGCLEIPDYKVTLYDYGSRISDTDIPNGTRIALICTHEMYEELSKSGTVSTTRFSVLPRVFTDIGEGIEWLTR
jgi:hypothetical protein